MIYLHDSPIRFHGALHTANCLVDSRWVVKLSDFGLREFKKGAEEQSLKDPNKIREKCYGKSMNNRNSKEKIYMYKNKVYYAILLSKL